MVGIFLNNVCNFRLKNTNVPASNFKSSNSHFASRSKNQITIKADPKVLYLPNITTNVENLNVNAVRTFFISTIIF